MKEQLPDDVVALSARHEVVSAAASGLIATL